MVHFPSRGKPTAGTEPNSQYHPNTTACGIQRDPNDRLSKSLHVKFPKSIIIKAKSREREEMPREYQRHHNLTGINPDRRDQETRRREVKDIPWDRYFSTSRANVRYRKEMIKTSELLARDNALTLEIITHPSPRNSQSPSSGNKGQSENHSEGKGARKITARGTTPTRHKTRR